MDVFLASWSPDDSRLAVMAREPGHAWRLYLVSAEGGEIHPLLQENRNAADPSWSPDGQSILFGRVNDRMGKEEAQRSLEILNLRDSSVTEVPGSAGLFSPRWSPNGRFIAALTLDQRRVRLFNVATKVWTTLPVASGADPVWAADSRSLVVHASMDAHQPIVRIDIPDMRIEQIDQLAAADGADPVDFVFVGLAADGAPLVRMRTYTGNIYSMDLP
jgi:Tol biopolymer transport system component